MGLHLPQLEHLLWRWGGAEVADIGSRFLSQMLMLLGPNLGDSTIVYVSSYRFGLRVGFL